MFNRRITLLITVCGLLSMTAGVAVAASPLGGQQTSERLDRRQGDRQLQARLQLPMLHEAMRDDQAQPQTRTSIRAREWNEGLIPRPQRAEVTREQRRRRVGITLD